MDPGIGFGKSVAGNHELLRRAGAFSVRGCPVVVGASRKSFLWKPMGLAPEDALEASLAAAVLAVLHGARVLRVHDVRETVRAVRVSRGGRGGAVTQDDSYVLFRLFGFIPVTAMSVLDFLIVTLIIYRLLTLIRGHRGAHMLVGLFVLVTVALTARW